MSDGCVRPLDVEGLTLGRVQAVAVALQVDGVETGDPLDVGFTSAGVAASFVSCALTLAGTLNQASSGCLL